MASIIETLKVYIVGIEFPASLNDPSPAKLIPLVGGSRTEDASRPRRRIGRMHRRVGVILWYDPVTCIAVVFLDSSRPTQLQRYLPWLGTPRLPFQPRHILQLDGGGGDFRNFPGYLNFTHAIRVMVVQPGVVNTLRNPGPATIHEFLDRDLSPPDVVHIRLALCEMETLKGLHALYWNGIRYTIDGTELGGGGGGGGGGVSVQVGGVTVPGTSVQGARVRGAGVSTQEGGGGVTSHGGSGGGVIPHGDGGVTAQEDQTAHMSMKLGRALAWEHFWNLQISIVEGDGDEDEAALDLDSLPRCFLGPLTEKDLQCEVSSYESSIGFPWEMNLGVDTSVQIES